MIELSGPNAPWANLGNDVASVCAAAEALCRAVAGPDLAGVPLYIVPQSSLPEECGSGDGCYAYTTPSLDRYLAEHIPDYRDRGPCMVLNDVALVSDYEPCDFEYVVPGIVLHELAHILDRPALYADRTGVDPNRIRFEALVVAEAGTRSAFENLPKHFGHGLSFTRIALHLQYRAERIGVLLAPSQRCSGFRYDLSHANCYAEALGNEPFISRMFGSATSWPQRRLRHLSSSGYKTPRLGRPWVRRW